MSGLRKLVSNTNECQLPVHVYFVQNFSKYTVVEMGEFKYIKPSFDVTGIY